MLVEVLTTYDRVVEMAIEAAPHEAAYCRELHEIWRSALGRHAVHDEQAPLVMRQVRHIERNLKAGLSASALVEWVDAFPESIMSIVDEQVV